MEGQGMRGIRYVVDDKGEPEAVLIDLKKHGKVWEDFQDLLVSQQRRHELRKSLAKIKADLSKKENRS